ncbi:hypothetical protein OE88DRAFT_1635156 [Heliocybe sulcata]|uniref:Uncharacterized protein n=1 Tax=Heliocybe sulcata TaxID=5364 RepID=A0A5C3MTT2_9AGAM|nr:hypothetical protein OE88DRAFT_1635156 [Heliocybe sulcata]
MRQHITKALQHHSQAIQNALKKHNTLAHACIPWHLTLQWNDIIEYSFLGEFDLLRHSRANIRSADWVTLKVLQLECTKEELVRLNVKIQHLRTYIRDDEIATQQCIKILEAVDAPLATEVQKCWAFHVQCITHSRMRLNILIVKK